MRVKPKKGERERKKNVLIIRFLKKILSKKEMNIKYNGSERNR